jgi:hypothetical protein
LPRPRAHLKTARLAHARRAAGQQARLRAGVSPRRKHRIERERMSQGTASWQMAVRCNAKTTINSHHGQVGSNNDERYNYFSIPSGSQRRSVWRRKTRTPSSEARCTHKRVAEDGGGSLVWPQSIISE